MAIGCDVSSPDSVRTAFAAIATRHPTIHVLINNAALYAPFPLVEATDEEILASVGTNLTGPMLTSRAAIPLMRRGAYIINVSSEEVELPFPFMTVYQGAKAGLERFTSGLFRELEPEGIRVSFVRAGQMAQEGKHWDIDPAAAKRFLEGSIAAGLNLRARGTRHYTSVTQIFLSLIDLPPDLHAFSVGLFGAPQIKINAGRDETPVRACWLPAPIPP
jgi:meso-butanediol dehydrogenase / (S,S)-butanediol dehydrogenase / diacetyl reductase